MKWKEKKVKEKEEEEEGLGKGGESVDDEGVRDEEKKKDKKM